MLGLVIGEGLANGTPLFLVMLFVLISTGLWLAAAEDEQTGRRSRLETTAY
jgi:hypothetical protein